MPEMKKKRPMGLKARAEQSKKKSKPNQGVSDFDEENTATVMLKNEGDVTEMDELEGIFDSAMGELNDSERATTLLRGTIHECDRILRVTDEQGGAVEPRLYYIYGAALYTLSEVAELSDARAYLELAKHRLEQAREAMEPPMWRVHSTLAQTMLELATADSEIAGALESFDCALDTLAKSAPSEPVLVPETLAIVDLVFSFAERGRLPDPSMALIEWGENKLCELDAAGSETPLVSYLRARALWIRASELLEQQSEDEVPEKHKVAELLAAANGLLEDAQSGDALLLRGEIQLNLGNVQDDEEEQERFYGLAVATFRQAQENGELPEQFAQFIRDFEQGDDGGDSDDDIEDEDEDENEE
ncbi:hypothetical protein GGI26_002656 [Coemansia sp. RSA 1358]|nr:hypothetical protein GGI26_002656 [Coemansia sp. RSA 1358]